jgi:type IV pilus assembly protein PilB
MNHSPLLKVFRIYFLEKHKKITQEIFDELSAYSSPSTNVVKYAIEKGYLTSEEITEGVSETLKKPIYNLDDFKVNPDLFDLFPSKLIKKHGFLPVYRDGRKLKIATSNPFDPILKTELKINAPAELVFLFELADHDKIKKIIDENFTEAIDFGDDLSDDDLAELEFSSTKQEENISESADDDAPIKKLTRKILMDCIQMDASDIHIEPYEHNYRIRYRVDGILQTKMEPKKIIEPRLSARFKILAKCDISEKRKPQDGRIKIKPNSSTTIDFRVNFLPTLFGEKIVLRKLDPTSAQMGIEFLGFEDFQKDLYMEALGKPQGMILVTGPTGSGKTVSLYTGLDIINTEDINISTAEDPVEINLMGINQVNVNAKQGLDFAEALRAFLRQDPDVIMVGEIRDLETANIGIKAAQTGHMVMSTLHTNSAAETITRLLNMGVPAFNVATVVNLIIAQRLARRLCGECKEKADIPKAVLLQEGFTEEQVDSHRGIYAPNKEGCPKCNNGYKGRVGIYEVVKITKPLSEAVLAGKTSLEFAEVQVQEGFNTLRKSAILKVLDGATSIEEINRVTQE